MNPRLATMATLGREVAIPALVLAWIGTSSFVAIDNSRATPAVDRIAPSLAADARFADKVADTKPAAGRLVDNQLADSKPVVEKHSDAKPAEIPSTDSKAADTPMQLAAASIDLPPPSDLSLPPGPALASIQTTEAVLPATVPAPVSREAEPIVTASLTDPSEKLSADTPPGTGGNTEAVNPATLDTGSLEVLDECFAVEVCVDRYLWALYQRTPKEDTVKIDEQRQVTIKRKGKTVTVTRTFSRRADQDFAWKDPKAAEKAGMTMADYVIGGMDRDFKLKLFHMLHFAEGIGMYPGITSAFRDDYRQSIASGLKAASNRSYHGGSLRGGYGHGLAADVVSVNGSTRAQRLASSQAFWKWIDAHGKEFGVGRPYLDHDPPHVGPMDGKEWADKRGNARAAESKPAHKPVKRIHTARS